MTKITNLENPLREIQIHSSPSISDEVAAERERLQEEKESTEQCLAICAKALEHIGQLQSNLSEFSRDIISIPGVLLSSKRVTANALQECRDILTNVTVDLEEHSREIKVMLKGWGSW